MKNGRRFGSPPKPYTPPPTPPGKINLTDPDSRLVHGMRGWVQGYNAQVSAARAELAGAGIPVLIPPDSSRRKNTNTRPGWTGGAYDFTRSVLSTERGIHAAGDVNPFRDQVDAEGQLRIISRSARKT